MKKHIYKIYGGNLRTIAWTEEDWDTCITLRKWSVKYKYSESGARGLIRDGKVIAKKIKNRWFCLDVRPKDRPLVS